MNDFSVEDVNKIIETIDVKKTGKINYTSFLAGCLNYKNYRQDEILRLLFNEIDVDGSKSIDKLELKQ